MKNKISFIMPRLVGATVLIGLVSFVLMTIFKLLIGAVIVGGIVTIAGKATTRREHLMASYNQGGIQPFGGANAYNAPTIFSNATQKTSTIIPIN